MSPSSKRPIGLILSDIIDAIDQAEEFSGDLEEQDFVKDALRISAVRYELLKISEAVRNLQRAGADLPPTQPWDDIYNLGNRLRHDYIGIDDARVFNYLKEDVPSLRQTVLRMIESSGDS